MDFNIRKRVIRDLKDTITNKQILVNNYYKWCMPENYENFNYINSLIEKNKSIGILSKISTDIITQEISKYISKKKDRIALKYSADKLEQYVLNKFIEKYPEIGKYIAGINYLGDFKQEYLKSNEYTLWRRERIEDYKHKFLEDKEMDIHWFKKEIEEDNKKLLQLKNEYCNFNQSILNILDKGEFKTLSIHYMRIHGSHSYTEEHFQFKNCRQTFKISSTETFSNGWKEMRVKQIKKTNYANIIKYLQDIMCYISHKCNDRINITIDGVKLNVGDNRIVGL